MKIFVSEALNPLSPWQTSKIGRPVDHNFAQLSGAESQGVVRKGTRVVGIDAVFEHSFVPAFRVSEFLCPFLAVAT